MLTRGRVFCFFRVGRHRNSEVKSGQKIFRQRAGDECRRKPQHAAAITADFTKVPPSMRHVGTQERLWFVLEWMAGSEISTPVLVVKKWILTQWQTGCHSQIQSTKPAILTCWFLFLFLNENNNNNNNKTGSSFHVRTIMFLIFSKKNKNKTLKKQKHVP